MNIIIVGDGGVGSNLSFPLVKMLKYLKDKKGDTSPVTIKIIDGKKVQVKNLIRQHFIVEDTGKFKAEITTAFLNDICRSLGATNIKVDSYPIVLKEDNLDIIEDGDVVFVGTDNYITRRIIEDHTKKLNNILAVFGGNDYDDGDVNVIMKEKGEYKTPLYSDRHKEILTKDKFPDEIGCEEAAQADPQLILANQTVANFMLEAFYAYLTNKPIWHEKMFDLKTGNVRTIR